MHSNEFGSDDVNTKEKPPARDLEAGESWRFESLILFLCFFRRFFCRLVSGTQPFSMLRQHSHRVSTKSFPPAFIIVAVSLRFELHKYFKVCL